MAKKSNSFAHQPAKDLFYVPILTSFYISSEVTISLGVLADIVIDEHEIYKIKCVYRCIHTHNLTNPRLAKFVPTIIAISIN